MRHSIVSGKFYPANKQELEKQIEKFFSNLEVASVKIKENKEIKAGIVPHAGYAFSGKCASFVYKLLKNQEIETFIILGTNHSGLGSKISLSIEDFDTPLGLVESNILLIEKIMQKASGLDIEVNEPSHKYEHSIEVQLPFLQSINKNFNIIPIILRDLSLKEIKSFSGILADIIKEDKKIFVLASSDFTHYGESYSFLPFSENIRENLYKLDNKIIDKILKLQTDKFIDEAGESTVCGKDSISVCMETAKNLNLKAEKLCYYTSGDVIEDWDNCVGYASIVFY